MDVFGSSGVRGVAGEQLTPGDTLVVAQAAGTVFDADRVALARDTRLTGPMFADSVASGLSSVGCDVDRLGVLPTPGLQAYCEQEAVPGMMVTASHNPAEFNGIKLVEPDGVELPNETLERVEALLESEPALAGWDDTGRSRDVEGAGRRYREQLLAAVDRSRIDAAELTVAVDPGSGAGSLTSPEIFADLGCTVKTLNAQPDGRFPGRQPEPTAETTGDLQRLVRAVDADLGVAHDGDADRAVFVDERGEFIDGAAVLAALTDAALERGETVVSAVNASQRLVDVTEQAGATLELTPVGSTYIITRMRELQAQGESVAIAGESNGGIMFPEYRIARDGAYTAARMLELVADQPASDLVASYDGYHNVRYAIEYESDDEREAMADAIAAAATESDGSVDRTDGHRLEFENAWLIARPSGTEPLFRVYAEASEDGRARELADWMRERIVAGRDDA
jgi:phosphomannomutase/phosphoglucomutase